MSASLLGVHALEFIEQTPTWSRLQSQGVIAIDGTPGELHLDLDDRAPVIAFDLIAIEHPNAKEMPATIQRVPKAEIGLVVEGVVHKLKLPEVVVMPLKNWRHVFDAVAEPMCKHEQWSVIDAAAMVELNTRDPLFFGPAHHHLLRDLVNAVVNCGEHADQGITVLALGVRLVMEVLPGGQVIVLAGDAHLAPPVRAVIEHHASKL